MKLIKRFFRFIDKKIIIPITKFFVSIGEKLKVTDKPLEKALSKKSSIIILSLVLAIIVFFIIDRENTTLLETNAEVLYDIPLSATYNDEEYVVEGLPETVDITLIGTKANLYLAKQLGDHKVVLDLSNYKTGEHTVKLKYNHSVESISNYLIPGSVTVKIHEKESALRTLTYDLLNRDKLDSKLSVSEVTLNESEVYVKGAKETLNKVATVKALVDLATLELKDAGTLDVNNIPMVAYDENGQLIENVEIVPSSASAKVKVESHYVDLPVKVVPIGTMATGYAINSATTSVTTVRVYGEQSILNSIAYIPAEIDVDKLSQNKEYKVTLTKPSGVRYMSETTTTVNVTVGTESTIEIELNSIDSRNLGASYAANLVNESDSKCVVILKGVSSVISKIDPSSIRAYVDLSGYGPGTYEVPVIIQGQDLTVSYTPKVQKISVRITNK